MGCGATVQRYPVTSRARGKSRSPIYPDNFQRVDGYVNRNVWRATKSPGAKRGFVMKNPAEAGL